jgi:hypothetical protein
MLPLSDHKPGFRQNFEASLASKRESNDIANPEPLSEDAVE